MPSYPEVQVMLRRADDGLLFLSVMLIIALASGTMLARRWPPARAASEAWAFIRFAPPPVLIILAGAVAARVVLFGQSFWYDEAFTLRMAALPWSAWPAAIVNDVHPPFFYGLIKIVSLAVDDRTLRLVPLAFGVLQIVLTHRLTLLVTNDRHLAGWAALIAALLPSQIYYGTELRTYTALACAVLGALIAWRTARPVWFAGLLVVVGALHNFGPLWGAALLALWLMRHRARPAIIFLPAIAWAACIGLTVYQSSIVADGYFPYFSIGGMLWPLLELTAHRVSDATIIPVVIPALLLSFAGLAAMWRDRMARPLLVVLLGVPLVVGIISVVWHAIYVPRTLYPAAALLPMAWALLLRADRGLVRVGMLAMLVASMAAFYLSGSANTRVDYAGILRAACPDTRIAYATSIPAAFVIAANTDYRLIVWDQASDDAGTFTSDDLPVYGFETAASAPADPHCLLQIDQPLTAEGERAYVAALMGERDHRLAEVTVSRWHRLKVYQVH